MADLNRPDYGVVFASQGEKLPPDSTKMQLGWVQEMMPYQWQNFLESRQDEAITYLMQKGVPEYSATQEYIANKSTVLYQGNLYIATATVTGVLPTVTASWKRISPTIGANGAVGIASGGTGATDATAARTNLGLGSIATANMPATNGVLVRNGTNSIISRTLVGTTGDIVVANPDGASGNITLSVGSNVAKTNQDSTWTSKAGITLPRGTTAERGTAVAGKIRYNTTLQKFEGYNGTSWEALGAASEIEITTLSGDGVTTVFILNTPVFSEVSTDVYIGGLWQDKGTYSVSGSTLTFSEAPTFGTDNIQVVSRRVVDLGVANASQVAIQDTSNYYSSPTVEGALREVGEDFAKLTSYTGNISADAQWSDVPAHSDPAFDVQAQALANRTDALNKRTDGLINVRAFIENPIDGVTSNQDGIVAAVAAAYAADAELEWPAGTYVSTANIPNFWDVSHKGKGVIKRETHTFMIKGGRTSFKNVFLSPSGSDSNDGLTPDVPIKSIQKVFDALSDMGAVRGRWVCNLASGVYTKGGILSGKKQLDYRITVKGPEVPLNSTPLAVFDGDTRETENGLFFDGCADLELRDIKFINFDSRPSVSAGLVAANTGVLRLINVHADECGVGYYPRNHTIYFVTGGKVTRCDMGILELFGVVRNFKNVTNIADGFKVTNCTYGLFAKEHCTGHLDFTTITDNTYGIFFSRSCTANASDSVIKRNQYGAVLRSGSYMVPLRIDWGHNTSDANTVAPWLADASSGFTVNENDVKATNSSGVVGFKNMGERQIGALIPSSPISITGTTAYTTPIFATVQQGSMSTAGLKFRVSVFGVRTTATSAANIELRIGGVGGSTVQLPASPGAFRVDFDVIATGSGSQYVSAAASVNGTNSVAVGRGVRAIPFAASDYPLAVRLTHTDSGDSALIDCAFAYSNESMKSDA